MNDSEGEHAHEELQAARLAVNHDQGMTSLADQGMTSLATALHEDAAALGETRKNEITRRRRSSRRRRACKTGGDAEAAKQAAGGDAEVKQLRAEVESLKKAKADAEAEAKKQLDDAAKKHYAEVEQLVTLAKTTAKQACEVATPVFKQDWTCDANDKLPGTYNYRGVANPYRFSTEYPLPYLGKNWFQSTKQIVSAYPDNKGAKRLPEKADSFYGLDEKGKQALKLSMLASASPQQPVCPYGVWRPLILTGRNLSS